jgi:hypothetical protein
MAPAIAAALISAAPAALKGIQGLAQGLKGSKLAKKNIRPTYEIPQEFQQNLAIAENMGRVGLPQQQYTQGLQNIQRGQTAGLRQLGRMGRWQCCRSCKSRNGCYIRVRCCGCKCAYA